MVPFSERRIYERLGIELYKDLAMPHFMLAPFVDKEINSDFKRITVPTKRKEITFDHTYFSGERPARAMINESV
jgi:hypothetical protein